MKYLWVWSLKKNDPSRYVHNPGIGLFLRPTLVICLRKESIGGQSAVLLIMEMVGEGTLVTICDSIHWESRKVTVTQLSLPNRYSEVILTYWFLEIWSRANDDVNLSLRKYEKGKRRWLTCALLWQTRLRDSWACSNSVTFMYIEISQFNII